MVYFSCLLTFTGNVVCITTSRGPQKSVPCTFPFTLNGMTYNGCAYDEDFPGENRTWCSTEVDVNGIHKQGQNKWGECGSQCPMDLKGKSLLVVLAFPRNSRTLINVCKVTMHGANN